MELQANGEGSDVAVRRCRHISINGHR